MDLNQIKVHFSVGGVEHAKFLSLTETQFNPLWGFYKGELCKFIN